MKKDIRIIELLSMDLISKDILEIKKWDDFILLLNSDAVFKFENKYYILSSEVVYYYENKTKP